MISKNDDIYLTKERIITILQRWVKNCGRYKDPAIYLLAYFYKTSDMQFLFGAYDIYAEEVDLRNPFALVKNKNYFGALTSFNALKPSKAAVIGFVNAHFPDKIKMRRFPDQEKGGGIAWMQGTNKTSREEKESEFD